MGAFFICGVRAVGQIHSGGDRYVVPRDARDLRKLLDIVLPAVFTAPGAAETFHEGRIVVLKYRYDVAGRQSGRAGKRQYRGALDVSGNNVDVRPHPVLAPAIEIDLSPVIKPDQCLGRTGTPQHAVAFHVDVGIHSVRPGRKIDGGSGNGRGYACIDLCGAVARAGRVQSIAGHVGVVRYPALRVEARAPGDFPVRVEIVDRICVPGRRKP